MSRRPTLLVIDDNASLRETLVDALRHDGWPVHAEETAVAAKAWLARHAPGLVLVDVMMPDMNGLEFCRWLRGVKRLARVPVLVMSAIRDEETVQDALELGAVDFLHKPFPVKALVERIDALLAQGKK